MDEWRAPSNLRAILFDKDGTIIDYDATWEPVNRRAAKLAAPGDGVLEARLLAACGLDAATGKTAGGSAFAAGNTADIAKCMVEAGSLLDAGELTRELDALFTSAAGSVVPLVDVRSLFPELAAMGFALGVATSDNEASARISMDALGAAGQFQFICGYDTGHGVKPEAGMLLAFAAAVGCVPHEVAMVGDNTHDLDMGRAAGAGAVIAVLSGTGRPEVLAPLADVCLPDISHLPRVLKS
ncbi:MAG: HAD family hydrolase [Rhodobiaceae bacterium]|nr:HAD family hydrolase [Rhodobiaceae bacterium]MCC0048105.1 HAD family hydrolase [Rhodobiaceae bacterium]